MSVRELKQDTLLISQLVDLQTAQEVTFFDRKSYIDVVLEALDMRESQGALVQKLYEDIMSKSNIDFGNIPESKGDITKYRDYPRMAKCIEVLEKLYQGSVPPEEFILLGKFHRCIIALRGDFTYGFKMDIPIIQLQYNLAVMTLYQLIEVNIVGYNRFLTEGKVAKKVNFRGLSSDLLVVSYAKDFLASVSTGKWAALVKNAESKTLKAHEVYTVMETMIALEDAKRGGGNTYNIASGAHVTIQEGKVKDDNEKDDKNGKDKKESSLPIVKFGEFLKEHKGVRAILITAGVIIGLITVYFLIRKAVYLYYSSSAKLKDWADDEKEFLDMYLEENGRNMTADAYDKNIKTREKLQRLSNRIEQRVLRQNSEGESAINSSNRSNFSGSEIKEVVRQAEQETEKMEDGWDDWE